MSEELKINYHFQTGKANGIKAMYRKMYWGVIFSRTACLSARWIAIKSLFIMRKWRMG